MRLHLLVLTTVLLAGSLAAHADDIYTVSVVGLGTSQDGTYTFDESSILTSDATIYSADFTSSSGASVSSLTIDPTSCPGGVSCVTVDYKGGKTFLAYYGTDLTSIGNYTDTIETLKIASTSTAPEPSSLILLGTGLLGFAGVIRRRLA